MENFVNREGIMANHRLESVDVFVPEWDGVIRIMELTGYGLDEYYQFTDTQTAVSSVTSTAKLIELSVVVPETGARLFQPGDYKTILLLGSKTIQELSKIIRELNGMGAEEIEETKKNSEPDEDAEVVEHLCLG